VSGRTLAEIYDPATGTFHHTGSSSVNHLQVTTTLLPNGTVLVAGGNPSNPTAEIFYPIDPPFLVQEFTTTGSLNTARYSHTATLLSNGLVLIAGGRDPSGNASVSTELDNPIGGAFTATGSLNTARYNHTATLLNNGLVLIAGGLALPVP